jgi:Ca-activated chloride channel family protein
VIPQASAAELQSAASPGLTLYGDLSLADPWFLALVPLGVALAVWTRRRRGAVAASVAPRDLPVSLRQRLAWTAPAFELAALAALALALARPLRANVLSERAAEGVDVVLAIDRSGSMQFEDLEPGRTRLEVVKDVVGEFAERRMTDEEGAADNCALLTFARYPDLLCPFTLDAEALRGFLDGVRLVQDETEDGTAIGVGLAKAVAVLRASDARSKVVVLLTDGENNVEDILPTEAAELAAASGVKVHTILAGRYVYVQDMLGRTFAQERELDSGELEAIAERTGGRFFRARDREGLREIYAEIERLERTPRHERRFVETFDLYPWVLALAIAAHALAWWTRATLARRVP